jgi:FhuF 2Fe-2S C-terminal domain
MRISDKLAEISDYGGFFAITVGGEADGWLPIARSYADGCADLINATAERYGTKDRRVAASLVQFSLASRLWSPAIACAVVHGIVPDFDGLEIAEDSAELRLPNPTGERIDSEERLAAMLYEVVVERNLEPLAAGLGVKLASGLLYGNIASAMVAATRALYAVERGLRDEATRLARSLLETRKLAGTGTVKHNLAFRRRSCCLYYRIADGEKCGDCGLASNR